MQAIERPAIKRSNRLVLPRRMSTATDSAQNGQLDVTRTRVDVRSPGNCAIHQHGALPSMWPFNMEDAAYLAFSYAEFASLKVELSECALGYVQARAVLSSARKVGSTA